MNKLLKTISIICTFSFILVLLSGCVKKETAYTLKESPVIVINWQSDTKGVQAADVMLKLEPNMSFYDVENILFSNSAVKDEFVMGQYKFPDGSTIQVVNDENDASKLKISIPSPEAIDRFADAFINIDKYKNIPSEGIYFDCTGEFTTRGTLVSKYMLSGEEVYDFYWIKNANSYAHASFYKSTGKVVSNTMQVVINGEQQPL